MTFNTSEFLYVYFINNQIMNSLFPLINRVNNSIGTITVKGVPDKLWRVLLLLLLLLVGCAYFYINMLCQITIIVIISLVLLLTIITYVFFMIKNPDYLRSENFHIRKQAIELLGDKDGLLPTNVENVINVPYSSPNLIEKKEVEEDEE